MAAIVAVQGCPGFAARVLAAVITLYQRYLSPYKGFRCAHRVAHGGLSCSAYAKQLLLRRGLPTAMRRMRERFIACAAAALMLHAVAAQHADDERRRRERQEDLDIAATCCSCDPVTPCLINSAGHGIAGALPCADLGACAGAAACLPF